MAKCLFADGVISHFSVGLKRRTITWNNFTLYADLKSNYHTVTHLSSPFPRGIARVRALWAITPPPRAPDKEAHSILALQFSPLGLRPFPMDHPRRRTRGRSGSVSRQNPPTFPRRALRTRSARSACRCGTTPRGRIS